MLRIEGLAGFKTGRREGARRGESEKVGKGESGKVGKGENGKAGLLFAPAERNVYRRAIGPRTALQRSAMWGLSESGGSGLKD